MNNVLPATFQPSTCRRGFSLVELLVVITILSALAAMTLPALRGVREKAKTVQCLSNLRQIGLALNMYLHDNQDIFPPCLDYVGWRGNAYVEQAPYDIQYMLNDYLGVSDGTRKNNMDSDVWVCPAGARFGRTGWSPNPFNLTRFNTDPSWGYKHNITYRWNSKPTRHMWQMWGSNGSMDAYPQLVSRLSSPSKAAVMWDLPDDLGNGSVYSTRYGTPELHGSGINCLFVDGHVQMVHVAYSGGGGYAAQDTLWWYAGEWKGQGWDGAKVPGTDQP